MTRNEFLDALCATNSKLALIALNNLCRGLKLRLIPKSSFQQFLDECVAILDTELPTVDDTDKPEALVRCLRRFTSRASVMRGCARLALEACEVIPVITVLRTREFFYEEPQRTHEIYETRKGKIDSPEELRSALANWSSSRPSWHFGKDRDFFWVAPLGDLPPPFDQPQASGYVDPLAAQSHRDQLGLSHYGRSDGPLLRAIISPDDGQAALTFYRPTAYDGLDNPAFRAACDDETLETTPAHGRTVVLPAVKSRLQNVDGTREWICPSQEVPWEYIAFDFLGELDDSPCAEDERFHAAMLAVLSRKIPCDVVAAELGAYAQNA